MTPAESTAAARLPVAEELAEQWLQEKKVEEHFREKRIEIEERLINLLGDKDEGTSTHKLDGFTVKFTARINRKIDENRIAQTLNDLPEDCRQVIVYKTVPTLDLKGVRWLQDNRPEEYAQLSEALEVKRGKTTVEISRN